MLNGRLQRMSHIIASRESDPVIQRLQLAPKNVPMNCVEPTISWKSKSKAKASGCFAIATPWSVVVSVKPAAVNHLSGSALIGFVKEIVCVFD